MISSTSAFASMVKIKANITAQWHLTSRFKHMNVDEYLINNEAVKHFDCYKKLHLTGFPSRLENRENLEKWESIF